jgi:arginase family enzyme
MIIYIYYTQIMENFFIDIPHNNLSAKNGIYNKFNKEYSNSCYDNVNEDDIPNIYNTLYTDVLTLVKNNDNIRPIVFSPDYSISSATCSAISEKYMQRTTTDNLNVSFESPVQILYFTSSAHINNLDEISIINCMKSTITNMMATNEISYTNHHFIINPANITLIGLNDTIVETDELSKLSEYGIKYFTLNTIRKKTIDAMCEFIKNSVKTNPVYIVYDLSVLSAVFAPSVFRFVNKEKDIESQIDGLSYEDIKKIFTEFKNLNIVGIDVTGYKLTEKQDNTTKDPTNLCAKLVFVLLNMFEKEKKINVFGTNTKFLIFRPVEKESAQDLGWYVLKGLPLSIQEELIRKIELSDNDITTFSTGDEEILIALTTIDEQQRKSFYVAETIFECALTPSEKLNMMFNLLQ